MKTLKTRALTIGLVARRAGVGVETVRFYERQGLIEEPPRRLSGYREYDDGVVSGWVSFVGPRISGSPSRKSRSYYPCDVIRPHQPLT